ncbi:sensor domain-containing diguanylate cyclase [soil metagenome]
MSDAELPEDAGEAGKSVAATAAQGLAARLLALHESSPGLLALFDEQDVLRHANMAFCQAYCVSGDEAISWADIMRRNHARREGALIESQDIEAWLAGVRSRRGKLAHRAFEADLCDGRWIWISETVQPGGWMLLQGSDITALRQDGRSLRQAHAKALAAAHTDGLTGLSNRRHGLQLLQDTLTQSAAWPLCVAMLDLDHFKQVNDELGHAAGDRVLCDFARQMQATIRREDGCARLGGEEFLLIFPAAALPQASAVVERLLARARRAHPLAEHPERGYTCSAGVAEAIWGETAADLIQRADAALYAAKAAGRDQLRSAG